MNTTSRAPDLIRLSINLPVLSRTRRLSIALFLGWAALACAVSSAIAIFAWSPQWKEFPNPFAAFAGSCVILWGTRSVLHREELGTASWSYALGVLLAYSVASFLEELLFRGYLLRQLTGIWGRSWALATIALAFGLFHLPGLTGLSAVKMVCTTGACSLLFSALYFRSGTLWSAVAAHLAMNWVLHTVLGVTGKTAFFRPVFDTTRPTPIDIGFWSLLLVVGGNAFVLLPKADTKTAVGEPLRSSS